MVDKEERLRRIRERNEDRKAAGQVGGVMDWFDIDFLLRLLDERCKNCKNGDKE